MTYRRHCRTKAYDMEDCTPTKPYVFEFQNTNNRAWQEQKDKKTNDATVQLTGAGQIHGQTADSSVQFGGEPTACNLCVRSGRECDGARAWCSKKLRVCSEKGQLGPWGQDPQTKCYHCCKIGSRCDGERPCGACIKKNYYVENRAKKHAQERVKIQKQNATTAIEMGVDAIGNVPVVRARKLLDIHV